MVTHFDYLFVDFMVEDNHRTYCNELISALNRGHSSLVIEKEEYINYTSSDQHRVITINTKEIVGNYPFKARYNSYYNYKNTLDKINGYSFDKIIVLGYDPVMFFFMYKKLISLGKVYIVEHHQLDEVNQSNWKDKLWNLYKDKVDHIVLDESIVVPVSENYNIPKDKIHVFPWPYTLDSLCLKNNVDKVMVLGISNSNDAKQLAELVDYERETGVLEQNNIELIIRKKEGLNIAGINSIREIGGYLSDDEFYQLYKECDIVLMPFPLNFEFRCSGTLIDALSAGKKVISSEILESKAYEKLFPEICKTYKDIKMLCDKVKELKETDLEGAIKRFFEYQESGKNNGIKSIEEMYCNGENL